MDHVLYLNSEEDYLDSRDISIEITLDAAAQLERSIGAVPSVALRNSGSWNGAHRALSPFSSDPMALIGIMAAGGDGSSDGVVTVRIYGYSWIAGLFLCARGAGRAGFAISALAFSTGLTLTLVGPVVGDMLG